MSHPTSCMCAWCSLRAAKDAEIASLEARLEVLEASKALVDWVGAEKQIKTLTEQRDALLAACEDVVEWFDSDEFTELRVTRMVAACRAAIEKARGGDHA